MPHRSPSAGGLGGIRVVGGIVLAGVIGVVGVGSAILRGNSFGGFGDSAPTDWHTQTTANITSTFIDGINEGDHASNLCGFRVTRANSLSVSNVQILSGGASMGQANATLSAFPVPAPGVVPLPGPCSAQFQFRYAITRTGPIRNQTIHTDLSDLEIYHPLPLGTVISGTLQDGDPQLNSGGYFDDYGVQMAAGQTVTLALRGGPSMTRPGATLDVAAAMMQNGTALTQLSDAQGNAVTRFVFTAPAAGMYFLRVVTGTNQSGAYQVQAFPGNVPNPA